MFAESIACRIVDDVGWTCLLNEKQSLCYGACDV